RDDCHLSANQISQQSWKTIVLALQPVVLDADVLSFDVAGFVEGFAERSHITRVGFRRPVSDKRDHRQRWLLRTRGDRPRRYCTTNKTYELASPHSRPEARHVMVANCDNAREGVDVRFTPESRHVQCKRLCPLWAKSGLMQRNKNDRYSITSSAVASNCG